MYNGWNSISILLKNNGGKMERKTCVSLRKIIGYDKINQLPDNTCAREFFP